MASKISKCLRTAAEFTPGEIADLEARAKALAGDEPVTNATYIAAAQDILAELRKAAAAPAAPAPAAPAPAAATPAPAAAAPTPAPTPTEQKVLKTFKEREADVRSRLQEVIDTAGTKKQTKRQAVELVDMLDDKGMNESLADKQTNIKYAEQWLAGRTAPAERYADEGLTPAIDNATMGAFADARAAARWLSQNGAEPWIRALAQRLMAAITPDMKFTLHASREGLSDPIRQAIGRASAGVNLSPNGNIEVHFFADEVNDQATLAHELVHAAAMRGIASDAALRGEMEALVEAVNKSLSRVPSDAGRYFSRLVANADELLAYGLTSPTLRSWMERMTPGGVWIDRPTPKEPTLWQRFVRALAKFLGLTPDTVEQAAAVVPSKMPARLEALLDRAMQATKDNPPKARPVPYGERTAKRENAATNEFKIPEPDDVKRMGHALNTIKGALTDWRNVPGALGWLSMRQIADRFGSKDPAKPNPVDQFVKATLRMSQRSEEIMAMVDAVTKPWRNLPQESQRQLGMVMLEATMEQVHPHVEFGHSLNRHLRAEGGAKDEAFNRERYNRIRAMYEGVLKTTPRAREVYLKVLDTSSSIWQMLADARAKDIVRAYAAELQGKFSNAELTAIVTKPGERHRIQRDLKNMPLSTAERRAMRALIEDVESNYVEQSQMNGPYFPLVRNGEHIVVAKSDRLRAAQAEFAASRTALEALHRQEPEPEAQAAHDEQVKATRDKLTELKKTLELLKMQDQHYAVTFFENRLEAEAYEKKLKADPKIKEYGLEVKIEQRVQHMQQFDGASPQFVRKLEEELRRSLPKAELASVQSAVREVYMRAAPDRSALKGELRRLSVPGARSTEMMRGFASRGMSNAFRISRMEHGGELQDALSALRTSDNRDELLIGNEMGLRLAHSFTPPQQNRVIQSLAQMSHLTFLGASPSYIMVNASQPWVITLPIMAARHGWSRSGTALSEATSEVITTIRSLQKQERDKLADEGAKLAWMKAWRFDVQPDKLGKTAAEKAMIKELFNDGLINITIEHDLGAVSSGANKDALGIASEIASTPAHVVEIVNRVATALAAFRLQQQKGASYAQSVDYATQTVADTHFDYSAENAPRLMRADSIGGLGRLVWQFKKYMQGMLYLIGKLSKDSVGGDKESLKALAYLHGMTLGVAGAVGLPVAGGVGLVFKAAAQMWDDDDEPEIGQMLYNGLQDAVGETVARAITKGLPAAAGVDISGRLGMMSLTNPLMFANTEGKEGRDLVGATLLGLAGPAGGMMANWADAVAVADKDPVRAFQLALPKVFSDPLKAYDRADRGIQSRSGTTLVPESEFGLLEALVKTGGFETTDVTDMWQQRAAFNAAKTRQNDARNALVAKYVRAVRDGQATGSLRDEIVAFNRRNPANKITEQTLQESRRNKEKTDRETVGGVRAQKKDADLMDQL